MCKQREVKCLVQVGAGDGYEADAIREATGCRAICIDADPKSAPASKSIEWHYTMIGATDCTTSFYVNANLGLSTPITRGGGEEELKLYQRRLDTFCKYHDIRPDALIVDTEGGDLAVIEGCGDLLDGVKLIYTEQQTHTLRPGMRLLKETEEFLSARGFTRHNELPTYDAGGQGNYTFTK